MDKKDKHIISILEKNSRTSYLSIAKELSLSEGAIRARVSKLLKKGIISRFTIETSNINRAIVNIETASHIKTLEIVKNIKKAEVDRIYEVTGKYSIVTFISGDTLRDINNKLELIRGIKGVLATETNTILS